MTVIVDLTPAARRLSELVRRIDDDQLGAPTPSGIPVAGMLDHVGGLAVAFAAAAAKDLGSVPPMADDRQREEADGRESVSLFNQGVHLGPQLAVGRSHQPRSISILLLGPPSASPHATLRETSSSSF